MIGTAQTAYIKKQRSWYGHLTQKLDARLAEEGDTLPDDEYDALRDESQLYRGKWEAAAEFEAYGKEHVRPLVVVTVDRKPVAYFKKREDAEWYTQVLRDSGMESAFYKDEEVVQ